MIWSVSRRSGTGRWGAAWLLQRLRSGAAQPAGADPAPLIASASRGAPGDAKADRPPGCVTARLFGSRSFEAAGAGDMPTIGVGGQTA